MKPTIFFSHSSLDSTRIKPIKEYILKKTGNAIEIFMSSDGASIPFGKNWLKEIEDALVNCKLMFVWVTPNSSKSNWIFFESGYAYSRSIKVVPIGFDGIKLEELPAPLNILQGFNISSGASLNNIMAIINREFELTFENIFTEEFYQDVVIKDSIENSPELLHYITDIKCDLYPEIIIDEINRILIHNDWLNRFEKVLKERQEPYTKERNIIYGIGYKIYTRTYSGTSGSREYPEIKIDPLSLNNIWNLLTELNRKAYEDKRESLVFKINLAHPFVLPDDHFLISSRLINSEVDLNTELPNVLYSYRNLRFRFNILRESASIKKEFAIIVYGKNRDPIPLMSLIKVLVNRMVIRKKINLED